MFCSSEREIELRRRTIRARRTGHRNNTGLIVAKVRRNFQLNSLFRSAGSVAAGVSALNNEAGFVAMERQPGVEPRLGEFDEVRGRDGGIVFRKGDDDCSLRGVESGGTGHDDFSWV